MTVLDPVTYKQRGGKIPEEVVSSQESEVRNHASVANVSLFSAQY